MKLAVILFWNIFLFTSCGCFNKSKSDAVVTNIETTRVITQEQPISFEYKASTRGYYQKIIITKSKILQTKKRGGKLKNFSCTLENWNNLISLLKTVNLEQIAEFKPPSKDFQFDGAPLTRLKVVSSEKTYETQGFDHGNPPKEIAALVKEILSISENIE
ncbi:hypothetical protein [uncultured Algibacter sp.]|uniref:hypothetical protein n=1 Tax=uncultured Algibacter sp. TaxID=298659 RepID=UPI0026294254|nr:hypothetical protein [uncultured Algibacter sp.]